MCDMFLILKTIYYADDTPFAVTDHIEDVMRSFEEVGENHITWFSDNQMKLNPDKCLLLLNNKDQTTLKIGNLQIKISCAKLLCINFDYILNFSKYIKDICQKASRKLNALARLAPNITSKNVL